MGILPESQEATICAMCLLREQGLSDKFLFGMHMQAQTHIESMLVFEGAKFKFSIGN